MNKKRLKTKKKIFNKNHCSLKNSKNNDSCLNNNLLVKIAEILNNYQGVNIKINTTRKKLYKQVSDKLNDISNCSSEKCWLTIQEIITHLSNEELLQFKKSFKPKKPSEWDKDPNTWLTTSQLELILDQLQDKYNDFKHYGALPMDFEKRVSNGCISGDLCNIDLQTHIKNNKPKIGVIFNLDDHDEPGSHWTSMYIELEPCCRDTPSMYYFDSVGTKPPKEIFSLVDKLQEQYKLINNNPLDFLYNDIQHQYKNTECGIYSLHFLETMLKGINFEEYIRNKNNDEYMEKFRKYYFIEE
tara:strand:+ start:2472 stop:3368 length:897 start_codon:yes stop_codon:yes gene_type:complete